MTLKFYMPPGSYATDIPFLLEVLYLPFDVTVLNLPAGDHANACRLPPAA